MEPIIPVTHDLGGFKVRRAVPAETRTMVGPFIFVDQFGPAQLAAGRRDGRAPAPAHQPRHRDLAVRRRDRPPRQPRHAHGDPARRGQPDDRRQRHRPFRAQPAASRADGPSIYGMQTWLALPDGKEEIDPAFEQSAATLPLIEDDGVSARVMMGALWGKTAPVTYIARRSTPRSCSTPARAPDRRRRRRARGDAGRRRGEPRRPAARACSRSTCSRPASR